MPRKEPEKQPIPQKEEQQREYSQEDSTKRDSSIINPIPERAPSKDEVENRESD